MQYFQEASTRAISTFVRQFRHGQTYEAGVVELIKQFAGGDDVGVTLNNILLKFEATFGQEIFTGTTSMSSYIKGHVQGHWIYVKVVTSVFMNTVCVATNKNKHDVYKYAFDVKTGHDNSSSMVVAKTTIGNFNKAFFRRTLAQILRMHWQDERCKYCERLLSCEGPCEQCLERINEYKCHFCQSQCGIMKLGQLKRGRGEPKVHYHVVCKKRKL